MKTLQQIHKNLDASCFIRQCLAKNFIVHHTHTVTAAYNSRGGVNKQTSTNTDITIGIAADVAMSVISASVKYNPEIVNTETPFNYYLRFIIDITAKQLRNNH